MITDTDITKLKTVFATKEDLKQMREIFATKEELQELRIDMNDGFHVLNEKMDGVLGRVDEVFNAVDFIAGKYREREQEDAVGAAVQARHGRQIDAIAEYIEFELPE